MYISSLFVLLALANETPTISDTQSHTVLQCDTCLNTPYFYVHLQLDVASMAKENPYDISHLLDETVLSVGRKARVALGMSLTSKTMSLRASLAKSALGKSLSQSMSGMKMKAMGGMREDRCVLCALCVYLYVCAVFVCACVRAVLLVLLHITCKQMRYHCTNALCVCATALFNAVLAAMTTS